MAPARAADLDKHPRRLPAGRFLLPGQLARKSTLTATDQSPAAERIWTGQYDRPVRLRSWPT
jgi:hypothetical protein